MMYIEMWSKDLAIHGDGESTQAKFDLAGWPFNLDFSGAGKVELQAEGMITAGPPEEMMDLECEREGTFAVITFPEPIQDRESMVVRLRAKMQV